MCSTAVDAYVLELLPSIYKICLVIVVEYGAAHCNATSSSDSIMPAEITKLPTNLSLRVEQTLRQRPQLFLPAALLPVTCLSVLQTACTAKTCLPTKYQLPTTTAASRRLLLSLHRHIQQVCKILKGDTH